MEQTLEQIEQNLEQTWNNSMTYLYLQPRITRKTNSRQREWLIKLLDHATTQSDGDDTELVSNRVAGKG